jgi:SAM-dependent methyltransferase
MPAPNPARFEAEFDRFADEYQAMHACNIAVTGETPEYFHRYKIESLAHHVRKAALASDRILDFGSGIGNSIPHFRSLFAHASLICADVSARSIAIASRRFPGGETHVLIKDTLAPIDPGSLDIAFSSCVFHHIDHAHHLFWLQELFDRLRPGGALCIFEHNPLNPLTQYAVNTCPFDVDARLIRAGTFARSLRRAGFTAVKIDYTIFFPRLLASLRRYERHLARVPLGAQYRLMALRPH